MTEQAAIRILKKNYPAPCYLAVRDALDMSISVLEKQIPKKPREYEDKYYGCPVCGNVLLHKWKKYPTVLMDKRNGLPFCLSCGQKLDWSDTDHK